MNKTTITVDGAVGDEVWYLEPVKQKVSKGIGIKPGIFDISYNGIITDFIIKRDEVEDIMIVAGCHKTIVEYSLVNSFIDHKRSVIYFTKSGARRARRRLLKQAKEHYSEMIWPGV